LFRCCCGVGEEFPERRFRVLLGYDAYCADEVEHGGRGEHWGEVIGVGCNPREDSAEKARGGDSGQRMDGMDITVARCRRTGEEEGIGVRDH
jgi:hypothetical protein